jgi:hypothetical protein
MHCPSRPGLERVVRPRTVLHLPRRASALHNSHAAPFCWVFPSPARDRIWFEAFLQPCSQCASAANVCAFASATSGFIFVPY